MLVLNSITLNERELAAKREKTLLTIPTPPTIKKQPTTESTSKPVQAEPAPVLHRAVEPTKSLPIDISYSLLPPEDEQNFTSFSATSYLSSPLNIDISTLIDEIALEGECNNQTSIVSTPCTASLVLEPKSTPLFSTETRQQSIGYRNDCGSLLGNRDSFDEDSIVKELCLGGINIEGEHWSLEFRGAMTYQFDSGAEKIEIRPCPEGEISECTTLGIGLSVDIP